MASTDGKNGPRRMDGGARRKEERRERGENLAVLKGVVPKTSLEKAKQKTEGRFSVLSVKQILLTNFVRL